ncbi:MAG: hypothetical protein NTZ25_04040 [Candidatus Peregrinibacteria bacterium]|nr:hypothetical protein [Candidatus Peregrinibacteria bacterium]
MPLGRRILDNQPRQEYFDDKSGAITLEIGFDKDNGVFLNEIFSASDRRTRGESTAITIENLSRVRVAEISTKIAVALVADSQERGVPLKTKVDELVAQLRAGVESLIADSVNMQKLTEAKMPFVQIARALDLHRLEVLGRQRNIVLGVLMTDEVLTQPKTYC